MIWVFPKIVVPPNHSFNRIFHYKPSILGYQYFWFNTHMFPPTCFQHGICLHPYVYTHMFPPICFHLRSVLMEYSQDFLSSTTIQIPRSAKNLQPKILLMVQTSGESFPPGMVLKPMVNNGISTTNLNW